MEKSKVYFTNMRASFQENLPQKMRRLMKTAGIADIDFENKYTAIKMHFGEPGNLAFLRPNYAAVMVDLVKELGGNIVFMRKLLRGSANRSFGIEVAGLSGLPKEVIDRAKEHLKQLEKLNITRQNNNPYQQLSIFNTNGSGEIIRILRDLDMDDVSPRGAYEILADLKEKATQS